MRVQAKDQERDPQLGLEDFQSGKAIKTPLKISLKDLQSQPGLENLSKLQKSVFKGDLISEGI